MNSSSLSQSNNKSRVKQQYDTSLPPINSSSLLKYQNNYENYEQQQFEFQQNKNEKSFSSESSLISSQSSIYSSSISSLDKHQSSYLNSRSRVADSNDSPNFLKSKGSDIQNKERLEYKDRTVGEIERDIKDMRKEFVQMNKKLSSMLDLYTMAKTQFVSKQLLAPSTSEFYKVQVQTNKKIEQAQLTQLKKLNETEFNVKDKDILLDLQKVLIQLREQLHQAKKQHHDLHLKNHKQDMTLDDLIKISQDNKDNNAVKLLQLQIIYYMKKLSNLNIQEEHLQHEEKLIRENDKNLELKVEELKKTHKYYYLVDENYVKVNQTHQNLIEKRKIIKKHLQTVKRSNDIAQEKLARQILDIDNQHSNTVQPKMIMCEQENQQLQNKISRLMDAYNLSQNSLKNITYKFSEDLIYKHTTSQKPFLKNILKPNVVPKSNLSSQGYLSARGKQTKNSNSNEKIMTHRYNDKNVSLTIDPNLQNQPRLRSISEATNYLKPRNFRVTTKKDKQSNSTFDKNKSYSTTIDHQTNTNLIDYVIPIQKPKLLKPKLLTGGNTKN